MNIIPFIFHLILFFCSECSKKLSLWKKNENDKLTTGKNSEVKFTKGTTITCFSEIEKIQKVKNNSGKNSKTQQ